MIIQILFSKRATVFPYCGAFPFVQVCIIKKTIMKSKIYFIMVFCFNCLTLTAVVYCCDFNRRSFCRWIRRRFRRRLCGRICRRCGSNRCLSGGRCRRSSGYRCSCSCCGSGRISCCSCNCGGSYSRCSALLRAASRSIVYGQLLST